MVGCGVLVELFWVNNFWVLLLVGALAQCLLFVRPSWEGLFLSLVCPFW